MRPFGSDLLEIYLQDHFAGSSGALELARRARGANEGTPLGGFLAELERELGEDRESLRTLMRVFGVQEDRLKVAAAWAAEKAGRLKLNGRLLGYSPLSRLVEVEALELAVHGKLAGWRALRALADDEPRLDPELLERLEARAEHQLERLREHHREAALDALAR